MIVKFRLRRDTAANWTANNPTLALGEPGLETDTRKVKYGDGSTAWNSLAYAASGAAAWADITGKPTTLAGYGITDAQPLDGDLTALAALSGTSTIYYRSAANTWSAVTVASNLGFAGGALGSALGTAATATTGTAGAVLGFLNAANSYSAQQTFLSGIKIRSTTPTLEFRNSSDVRLAYFQHDASDMFVGLDVGDFVTRVVRSQFDNTDSLGTAARRWSVVYAGTGTINTSDRRAKRDIGAIPDDWLDAWGDVEWCRYRFKDGDRWHVGLVAQQVRDAFANRGLDAREIGLLCYDEWEGQRGRKEKLDEAGNLLLAARPSLRKGYRWGLRYDECQSMEAAWQRREMARLRATLTTLTQP
ncbi:hyaluronate lyase N-terminal domain-containing protein [Sphingomonas koreensis]